MVCEGILNLCGTSSKEIEERAIKATKEIYIPKIDKLTQENNQLSQDNERYNFQINELTQDNERLQRILIANGITF